jgi:hypothetical protein
MEMGKSAHEDKHSSLAIGEARKGRKGERRGEKYFYAG